MRIPNGERAVVPLEKLLDYCLNPEHPRGQHKARVFSEVLGITKAHADELQQALLAAAATGETRVGENDAFGQRFVIDFEMEGPSGKGIVRSLWIVLHGQSRPRLTSCYVR